MNLNASRAARSGEDDDPPYTRGPVFAPPRETFTRHVSTEASCDLSAGLGRLRLPPQPRSGSLATPKIRSAPLRVASARREIHTELLIFAAHPLHVAAAPHFQPRNASLDSPCDSLSLRPSSPRRTAASQRRRRASLVRRSSSPRRASAAPLRNADAPLRRSASQRRASSSPLRASSAARRGSSSPRRRSASLRRNGASLHQLSAAPLRSRASPLRPRASARAAARRGTPPEPLSGIPETRRALSQPLSTEP